MPELAAVPRDHGAQPPRPAASAPETAARVGPLMGELVRGPGHPPARALLRRRRPPSPAPQDVEELTSAGYLPDPSGFMSAGINQALAYIDEQPDRGLRRGRPRPHRRAQHRRLLARLPPPHRARARAVRQPAADQPRLPAPDARRGDCGSPRSASPSGFNNLSNFNRQFLRQKGMTPSRFRALLATTAPSRRRRRRKRPSRPDDQRLRRRTADAGHAEGTNSAERGGRSDNRGGNACDP